MRTLIYIYCMLTFALLVGCEKDEHLPPLPDAEGAWIQMQSTSNTAVTNVRLLAFDEHHHLISERESVTGLVYGDQYVYELPVETPLTLVSVGNAGVKGDGTFETTPVVGVTMDVDEMFLLSETGGRLEEPAQYFHSEDRDTLVKEAYNPLNVKLCNLTSRIEVVFNGGASKESCIDSVVLYVEGAGKSVDFYGRTINVGTTKDYAYKTVTGDTLEHGSFLIFPTDTIQQTPVIKGTFYFKSGLTRDFEKVYNRNFVSNKQHRVAFDLSNLQADIPVEITVVDWEDSVKDTITSSVICDFVLKGGNASNYTHADVTVAYKYNSTTEILKTFPYLPVTVNGGNIKTSLPVDSLHQGDYTLKGICLYDDKGSFEALDEEIDFMINLGENTIALSAIGRTEYENRLIKEWFLILDGNSGNSYPGAAYVPSLTDPTYDIFADAVALGLTMQNVNGEDRLGGIDIPSGLSQFNTLEQCDQLLYLSSLVFDPTQTITNLDLQDLSHLSTIDVNIASLTSLNVNGLEGLNSLGSMTNVNLLTQLHISNTGIKVLNLNVALNTVLETLSWASCSLIDSDIVVVEDFTKIIALDLSYNLLESYPSFPLIMPIGGSAGTLVDYKVQGNNIKGCALDFMRTYTAKHILPQRNNQYNFWCP